MSDTTIKPCPFCGGTGCLWSNYSGRYRQFFIYVRCDICGSQGKTYACKEDPELNGWSDKACNDAIKAWNMRTADREEEHE